MIPEPIFQIGQYVKLHDKPFLDGIVKKEAIMSGVKVFDRYYSYKCDYTMTGYVVRSVTRLNGG